MWSKNMESLADKGARMIEGDHISMPPFSRAQEKISLNPLPIKHQCNRFPIIVCSEEEFLWNVQQFLVLKGHHRLISPRGVTEFPHAILYGKRLDLFNLYKQVVFRGVFNDEKDINWKGEVFPMMLNYATIKTTKAAWLLHMDSGIGVLALCCNASHKLCKWQLSERNPSGKSSASISPYLWQPYDGVTMNNHTNPSRLVDESTACFAMSKNGSYLLSASGEKVFVFKMATFKVITTFMASSPSATCIVLYLDDNNAFAIGSDDSIIRIYDIKVNKVVFRGGFNAEKGIKWKGEVFPKMLNYATIKTT